MSDVAITKTESKLAKLKPKEIVGTSAMRDLVSELTPRLVLSLPSHLKAAVDRMGASLIVEMSRNEYVAKSTARSLLGGLVQVAHLGLELGGPLGQCFLVPYRAGDVYEAQFMIGYRGLIKLASQSGMVLEFDAQPVHDGDDFAIGMGTKPFVRHSPILKGVRTEENLIGCYAYAHLKDAEHPAVEWMTADELRLHRDRYSKAKGGTSPWQTAFVQMAVKTVLRRLAKTLPMSAEMSTAASLDEMADEDVPQRLAANLTPFVEFNDPTPKAQEVAEAIGAGRQDEELGADDVPR